MIPGTGFKVTMNYNSACTCIFKQILYVYVYLGELRTRYIYTRHVHNWARIEFRSLKNDYAEQCRLEYISCVSRLRCARTFSGRWRT